MIKNKLIYFYRCTVMRQCDLYNIQYKPKSFEEVYTFSLIGFDN